MILDIYETKERYSILEALIYLAFEYEPLHEKDKRYLEAIGQRRKLDITKITPLVRGKIRYGSMSRKETEDDKKVNAVIPMFLQILESFEIPITGYNTKNEEVNIKFTSKNCKIADNLDIFYDVDNTVAENGLPLYPQGFKNILTDGTLEFIQFKEACKKYNEGQRSFIVGSKENHRLIDAKVRNLAHQLKKEKTNITNNKAADIILKKLNIKSGQYPSKSQVINLISEIIPKRTRGKINR